MSKKSFKIARKPGQANGSQEKITPEPEQQLRARKSPAPTLLAVSVGVGPTTRKTIEVPEDYFFRVKMRALERHILEKELWAEILLEYFKNHPTL